ncbi:hypothetical protein BCEP27_30046 [Burkholderia cepacia]
MAHMSHGTYTTFSRHCDGGAGLLSFMSERLRVWNGIETRTEYFFAK